MQGLEHNPTNTEPKDGSVAEHREESMEGKKNLADNVLIHCRKD